MLPAYIIDKIIKGEREKEPLEELIIECPEPNASDDRDDDLVDEETVEDRGIVILDFTI